VGHLPEAHTDFIFAVLGEELGLVGTLLVLGLFLTIAYAAIRVAPQTRDPFVRYVSFGITVWLLGQMIVNVGMVLACCRSSASRCRWCPTAAPRCCRPWSRSGC
jgi:cell division protein FtsW